MNLYVGNLPFNATEDEVRELFAAYGEVTSVAIIKDKFSGKSRGFAFVEMPDEAAQKAIQGLNNKDFKGRAMTVNQARPREERGGYGGRGGGGYDRRGPGGGRPRNDR